MEWSPEFQRISNTHVRPFRAEYNERSTKHPGIISPHLSLEAADAKRWLPTHCPDFHQSLRGINDNRCAYVKPSTEQASRTERQMRRPTQSVIPRPVSNAGFLTDFRRMSTAISPPRRSVIHNVQSPAVSGGQLATLGIYHQADIKTSCLVLSGAPSLDHVPREPR